MRLIDADEHINKFTKEAKGTSDVVFAQALMYVVTCLDSAPVIEHPAWISVDVRLPEEGRLVEIWCGTYQIAKIKRGITEAQREAMKRGELEDPEEAGWTLADGYFKIKRSSIYKACDVFGNNKVPYCWYPNGGPGTWFGQEVTHWRELSAPPKGQAWEGH